MTNAKGGPGQKGAVTLPYDPSSPSPCVERASVSAQLDVGLAR